MAPGQVARGLGQFAAQFLAQVLEDLLEDGAVEILFGPEVPVDDQFGHAAAGGHVVHGRLGESGVGEGTRRALEDGGASFGAREELALDLYT